MVAPDAMRASDAERDAVLARLREALVEGRLEPAEFDERAGVVLRSRTVGQLAAVTEDLPPAPARPLVARSPARTATRVSAGCSRSGWPALSWSTWFGWLPIFAVCVAVWLVTGQHGFWPGWLLFWLPFGFRHRSRPPVEPGQVPHPRQVRPDR